MSVAPNLTRKLLGDHLLEGDLVVIAAIRHTLARLPRGAPAPD